MTWTFDLRIKRVYESPDQGDGKRVLVDRVWPRGVTKGAAALDLWSKEIAPSAALRTWYGHDPAKWGEFKRRYRAELDRAGEAVEQLRSLMRTGRVTLVYAARDEAHSNAAVLRDYMLERKGPR